MITVEKRKIAVKIKKTFLTYITIMVRKNYVRSYERVKKWDVNQYSEINKILGYLIKDDPGLTGHSISFLGVLS
jgi:hypothetical protein